MPEPWVLVSFGVVLAWMVVDRLWRGGLSERWRAIADRFPTSDPPPDTVATQGRVNGLRMKHPSVLLGVTPAGLYVAAVPFFDQAEFPPMLVPWSELTIGPSRRPFRTRIEVRGGGTLLFPERVVGPGRRFQ